MIAIQLDIWGNVTCVSDGNGPWSYKQTFFEDELLKYEDNLGNYWTKEFGLFQFSKITFDYNIEDYNELLCPTIASKLIDDEIVYRLIGYSFPSMMRVMPSTLGSELISVQPMSEPIGQLFYVDYIYGDKKEEKWYQKIKSKFYLVMSKIYRIFVKDKLKII